MISGIIGFDSSVIIESSFFVITVAVFTQVSFDWINFNQSQFFGNGRAPIRASSKTTIRFHPWNYDAADLNLDPKDSDHDQHFAGQDTVSLYCKRPNTGQGRFDAKGFNRKPNKSATDFEIHIIYRIIRNGIFFIFWGRQRERGRPRRNEG